jgi:hypothetical protein
MPSDSGFLNVGSLEGVLTSVVLIEHGIGFETKRIYFSGGWSRGRV